jgi:DNA-binding response OmpR family regulator
MAPLPPRILVIDDSADLLRILDIVLSDEGFVVDLAPSAKAATELLLTTRPDLIICDLGTVDIGNFRVLSVLDANEKTRGTPVLFCTASDARRIGPALAAFNRPETAVLYKPFDLDDLLAHVVRLCRVRRSGAFAEAESRR